MPTTLSSGPPWARLLLAQVPLGHFKPEKSPEALVECKHLAQSSLLMNFQALVARKVSGKVENEVLQPRDGEGGQKQLTFQGSEQASTLCEYQKARDLQ